MAPRVLEVVFLSLSPRLYTMRALIISSLLILSVSIGWTLSWPVTPVPIGIWITLYAFIAAHQIISIVRLPVLYGVIELPFLLVEVIGAGHYAKFVLLQSWVPETLVFHAVLAWFVVGTLSLTIWFRTGEIICSRGQSLMKPFDILAHESKFTQSDTLKTGWKGTFHMLFGRSIWRKNFVGETMSIRVARGILAIIVLTAVFFYALLNVVFAPIKETALSPVKTYRISGTAPLDLLARTNAPVWRLTFFVPGETLNFSAISDAFFSAVDVVPVQPYGTSASDDTNVPQCQPQNETAIIQDTYYYYFYYLCPPISTDNVTGDFLLPDLTINVDFGRLSGDLPNIFPLSPGVKLPLVIGLSNSSLYDYTRTVPVTIIPGINLNVPYILGIRQIYTNGVLAAFGIFEATKTFFIPQIVAFYPDPTATFVGSNLSSLNIFQQDNYGEILFIQDYREKSVISGFSVVGGLWTAFSGIFAVLFGASMLHVFYGSKPLSIFGIAHKFQSEAMKKDCLAKYPQILKENRSPEQRGLLSLLRDHLISLDFLEDEKNNDVSPEDRDKQADVESSLFIAAQAPDQI